MTVRHNHESGQHWLVMANVYNTKAKLDAPDNLDEDVGTNKINTGLRWPNLHSSRVIERTCHKVRCLMVM